MHFCDFFLTEAFLFVFTTTQGKPLPLLSNYKLTYYTLLNLLRRVDGTTEQEKTIERSFHQYQHQVTVPAMRRVIEALREEDASVCPGMDARDLDKNLKNLVDLQGMRRELMRSLLSSETCFTYLCPGRLVHVVDGTIDWGWGIVVSCFKKVRKTSDSAAIGDEYVVDVMLPCRKPEGGSIGPLKTPKDPDIDTFVVPVACSCIT